MAPPGTASAALQACLLATLLATALPTAGELTAAPGAEVTTAPAAEVQRLQQALLELDRGAPEASARARYQRLEPLVRATHDFASMARLALGPDWESLEEPERLEFTELLTRLGVANYAERFRGLAGERFVEAGQRELRGGRVEVRSLLQSADGSSVTFTYVLHRPPDGNWRIINILADGVSELALQRSEYRRVLAEQGWDGLVAHMKNKSELVDL